MLRKRARSIQKDQNSQMVQITSDGGVLGSETCLQQQSDLSGQRQKTNSFFNNVPGLFVGLSPNNNNNNNNINNNNKAVSDYDSSVRSPTSPLDFKLFSNLRFPKPCHQKSWDSNKVGLGSIVDANDGDNDDDNRNLHEKKSSSIIPSCNSSSSNSSKNIVFGSQVRSKAPNSSFPTQQQQHAHFCEAPKSLPKNYAIFAHAPKMRVRPSSSNLQKGNSDVLFEIGEDPFESDPDHPFGMIHSFSLDSKRFGGSGIHQRLRARDANLRIDSNNSCSGNGIVRGSSSLSLRGGGSGSPIVDNKLPLSPKPGPIDESGNGFCRSLTPSEIELSEDYTRVISHGPNPKTTHIFGDCVLGCQPNGTDAGNKGTPCLGRCLEMSSYPSNDFLSYCHFCKKKLEEGKDIYMYRGEKAFCSWDCRSEGISIEEEKEKAIISEASGETPPESENGDESFEKSIFVAL